MFSSKAKAKKKLVEMAKNIVKDLGVVVSAMHSFGFVVAEQPVAANITRSGEIYSSISRDMTKKVIGQDKDKYAVVKLLLDSDHDLGHEGVVVIPIVGMGGLGKTTLAQLVFNDALIQTHFELRVWACISEISSLEELLRRILESLPTRGDFRGLGLEQLRSRLWEAFRYKKYLLVLDDVWDEDRLRWLALKGLLSGGKPGSKVIVTTRSGVVARLMDPSFEAYEMRGLSNDDSWALFRRLVFQHGQEERNPNLVSIGREIVKRCANIPLAIKTTAALLHYRHTEAEWRSFLDEPHEDLMSTLVWSCNSLPPPLRQCFAYCSLFPKDYQLKAMDLIYLWMAQGFIQTQSWYAAGRKEEAIAWGYFMELRMRSFFKDDERDLNGDIVSCQMQDLMNDLARQVAGEKCLLVDGESTSMRFNENSTHVSFIVGSSWEAPTWVFSATQLRSLLLLPSNPYESTAVLNINEVLANLKSLRALDLAAVNCENFPNSIVELKQLRYLRLGGSFQFLPEAITRLQSLQTLDLQHSRVRVLPRGFTKLINLRHLHTGGRLIYMPPGVMQLTSLQASDVFIVGENNGLDALAGFDSFDGKLEIRFEKNWREIVSNVTTGILKGKKVIDLALTWSSSFEEPTATATATDNGRYDMLLESLHPPRTLRSLAVRGWKGGRLPQWGMDELPNLVSVHIVGCSSCQHLPALSQLPSLKFLKLWGLKALEYIETGRTNSVTSSAATYFSSLESLELYELRELKGWSNLVEDGSTGQTFPRLSELRVSGCPKLMSMPEVPRLRSLDAYDIHAKLLNRLLSSTPSTLRKLYIDSVQELDSLSINQHSLLESLKIKRCQELVNLVLESPMPLRRLEVGSCGRLKAISNALLNLSGGLEELEIEHLEELDWEDRMDDNEELTVWQRLKTLRSLTIRDITKLKTLPSNLGCLTMLEELRIDWLYNLRALPEWIRDLHQLRRLAVLNCHKLKTLPESFGDLTCLEVLQVSGCPILQRRCRQPDGEYWHLIQHIPRVHLGLAHTSQR